MPFECQPIPSDLDRSTWDTHIDVGRSIPNDDGSTPPPPAETFRESQSFHYMSDTVNNAEGQKRAFSLSLFNDQGARACLLQWAGFTNADIAAVQTILQNPLTPASVALRTDLIEHLDDYQQSLLRAMRITAVYQQPYAAGDPASGGNIQNPEDTSRDMSDPTLVTAYEIEQVAGDTVGMFEGTAYSNEIKAQIRTLNSVLGALERVTVETVEPPPEPEPAHEAPPEVVVATPDPDATGDPVVELQDEIGPMLSEILEALPDDDWTRGTAYASWVSVIKRQLQYLQGILERGPENTGLEAVPR